MNYYFQYIILQLWKRNNGKTSEFNQSKTWLQHSFLYNCIMDLCSVVDSKRYIPGTWSLCHCIKHIYIKKNNWVEKQHALTILQKLQRPQTLSQKSTYTVVRKPTCPFLRSFALGHKQLKYCTIIIFSLANILVDSGYIFIIQNVIWFL